MNRKFTIADLKDETIPVSQCRKLMKIGGFESFERHSDWQPGWWIENDGQMVVGLSYQTRAAGLISLTNDDLEEIKGRRIGDPDELRMRKRREQSDRHEILLWRLEKAQAAVFQAIAEEKPNLVEVATEAFNA